MKDYSQNYEDSKKFILGYDIVEGDIVIKFSNGEKYVVPNNEKNIEIILKKMEEQVNKVDEEKFISRKKTNIKISIGCVILLVLSTVGLASTMQIEGLEIAKITMFYLPTIATIPVIGNIIVQNNKIKDLQKNKRFMSIKDEINQKVRNNENMLVKTSNKKKNIVLETPENKEVFNINSFNYVPFRDLEQIEENIERDEFFGFDYETYEEDSEIMTESKGKIKVRKPMNP